MNDATMKCWVKGNIVKKNLATSMVCLSNIEIYFTLKLFAMNERISRTWCEKIRHKKTHWKSIRSIGNELNSIGIQWIDWNISCKMYEMCLVYSLSTNSTQIFILYHFMTLILMHTLLHAQMHTHPPFFASKIVQIFTW